MDTPCDFGSLNRTVAITSCSSANTCNAMTNPWTNLNIHFGRGRAKAGDFLSISSGPDADILADLRLGLPIADGSVARIYSDGYTDKLGVAELACLFRECRRVLAAGGRARIACSRKFTAAKTAGHYTRELVRLAVMAGLSSEGVQVSGQSADSGLAGMEKSYVSLVLEFRKIPRRSENSPLVSILIPAYNSEFFAECLESAMSQSYENIEVIVCDDSDNGEIKTLIEQRHDSDRVIYHSNPENIGTRKNYLKCFELSSGSYIKYLNDDDTLDRDCVRRMADVLNSRQNVSLVTSRRRLINETGESLPDTPYSRPIVSRDSLLNGALAAHIMLVKQNNFIGEPTTTMFRREDMQGFSPDMTSFAGRSVRGNVDVSMWLNLLCRGDLVYLVDILSCFRLHSKQVSQRQSVRDVCLNAWKVLAADAQSIGLLGPRTGTGTVRALAKQPGTIAC